jgi:DNA-binding NtrC family response regulator
MPTLLAISEMGGYPTYIPLYRAMGFTVEVVNSMRKARSALKKQAPDVIVAEYNFQSQFRDRTSNLETLMAALQKHGGAKVIAFYEKETRHKLDQLTERFPLHATLTYPVQESELRSALAPLADAP